MYTDGARFCQMKIMNQPGSGKNIAKGFVQA